MKITIISPYEDLMSFATRNISAYLKEKNHEVKILFLPIEDDNPFAFNKTYSDELLTQIKSFCEKSDMIAISLMTIHFEHVKKITKTLKSKKIILGGIHPTLFPEECLKHANIVCVGEGEEAITELADNPERTDIKNLIFNKNGKIIKNEVRHFNIDFSKFPNPDYDIETHYISSNDEIIPLTVEEIEKRMWIERGQKKYCVITTKGCPGTCTFCSNSKLMEIYKGKGSYIRKRSISAVIKELERAKKLFPFIQRIGIMDETFFVRSLEEVKEFCKEYKEKIGLPLTVDVSPMTYSEEKYKLLVEAGVIGVQMGVQTGSETFRYETFKRYHTNAQVINTVDSIKRCSNDLEFCHVHFLTHNPLESNEDFVKTIKLALDLPNKFFIGRFPIKFFPGLEITKIAESRGIEVKEVTSYKDVRQFSETNYLNHLFMLLSSVKNRNIIKPYKVTKARFLIDFMLKPCVVTFFDRPIFLKPAGYLMTCYMRAFWNKKDT